METSTENLDDTAKIKERDLRYGWFSFRPQCLQFLNRPAWLLFFISLGNSFQSMTVNGLLGTVVSTLEKRYDLTSSQSSWIASAYEIGTVPILIILSYVGTRVNRPFWTAGGFFVVSLGSILFLLPHITTPEYIPGGAVGNNLCRDRSNDSSFCDQESTDLTSYLGLFIFARVLHGMGATPIYILGITYLDDMVSKETFSLYVGIFYALGVIGPAVGTIAGGQLLNLYVDFPTADPGDLGLSPGDPRWIGAWWLGFVIAAIICFLIAIPISGYPVDLPGGEDVRKQKESEAYNDKSANDDATEVDYARNIRDLPKSLKVLITNPTYVCLTLFISCDSLIIGGFTAFGPKYVENQFTVTPSLAAALFGIVLLPAGAGGTIVGGYLIKRLKLTCKSIMKWEIVLSILVIIGGLVFFIVCTEVQFAGVTVAYNSSYSKPEGSNISATCNMNCMCTDVAYDPICSPANIRYFSPCHAGCTLMMEENNKAYYNCSCIPDMISEPDATPGGCTSPSCTLMPLFMVLFGITVTMTFVCNTMNISGTVRSIPAAQRSLAVGIQWIMLRCLGTIPGPIVFGAAFDSACQLWGETCGSRTSCLFYENYKMAVLLFVVCLGVKVPSLLFATIAHFTYKPPPGVEKREQPESIEKTVILDETKTNDKKADIVEGVLNHMYNDVNGIGNGFESSHL